MYKLFYEESSKTTDEKIYIHANKALNDFQKEL